MDCYSLEIARRCYYLCHAPFAYSLLQECGCVYIAYNFNETRDIITRLGSAFHHPSIDIASMTCDLISIDVHHAVTPTVIGWPISLYPELKLMILIEAVHRNRCCQCSREEIGDTCCGISGIVSVVVVNTVSFPAERTIVARTPLLSCHAFVALCLVPYLVYTRTFSFR